MKIVFKALLNLLVLIIFHFYKNIRFKTYISKEIKNNKIFKNNKLVYSNNIKSNNNISNYNHHSNSIKIFKKLFRNSSYRGISKNGNKWQVLLMNNKIKYYLGNYISEETAAKIYDFFVIKFRGKKSITNFFYNEEQIKKINEIKIDKIDKLALFSNY